ncbi:MAG: Rieske (2Fe-2S) protein [Bacteroidetes bacterium]|nr:Rieske (2Fe-2S) protein [Bacteroidota bacterium]MCW5894806.1 Rieske (2Fe-2S) protein [Bacteroidota bacterium]
MDRNTFLRVAGTAVLVAPVAALLQHCASGRVVHAIAERGKVTIPVSALPDLATPGSFAKVYVDRFANPIIVFEGERNELHAILSTCSHSGCEVRKLPTKFECPCHGSEYNLRGNVLRGPAPDPLNAFEVRRRENAIEIHLG